jgi:hypothetical protein
MQSLRIDTGSIRLAINDDESRVIEFNPNDLAFIDRFYGLIGEFESKEKEYQQKLDILNQNTEMDAYNIPKNMGESLALLKEICGFMRDRIDYVFGEGTSQKVFGNDNTLDMFEQFFNGITPYIQQARTEKVEKYTGNRAQRRAAARVMK